MKLNPLSFISFLLLLLCSGIAQALVIPDTGSINSALVKRGCVPSKQGPICTEVPSVADLVKKIQQFKAVGKMDSLFYSGLGGGSAIQTAKTWHKANAEKANKRAGVAFDGIVDETWYLAQAGALQKQSGGAAKVDSFQKRLSQAFAEASNGKVYFFTATGQVGTNFPASTAWGGWEFPALTRNPSVTQVIQVSMTGNVGTTQTIWAKGQPATPHAPLG